MAALRRCISGVCSILSNSINLSGCNFQQTRNHINARMKRDMKRRRWTKKYAEERLRLVVMKRNDILPIEIRELVSKQIDETIPRQTALRQLTPRCVVTSRAYGTVHRWRISRFIFRDLIDYNKMAGMQRAIW
ncbi:28S ribosomal protein S14, mitochondrial [Odontomachus brunneus]|uniref:28S ribosomal protein S14, mitochondrial n=1 Tax=Odontomachus brunneus TaxID=486640 RepID=UPI0013F18C1B|nr:28S ribosomal protein S14, mitochondrial [Odontomachus brunneus]